jgi:hypothetical protein
MAQGINLGTCLAIELSRQTLVIDQSKVFLSRAQIDKYDDIYSLLR